MNPWWSSLVEAANEKYHQAFLEMASVWRDCMLFGWRWWLDLALSILPWAYWFMVRDKKRTHNLLYAGFVILVLSSFSDMIGMSFGLWGYHSRVVPFFPAYVPWDFSVIPVMAMLFYQYFPNIKPYYKGLIFSAFGSFVVQPVFAWLGTYDPKEWKHYYSFPIVLVYYLIGYWFYKKSLTNSIPAGDSVHPNTTKSQK